MAKHHVPDEPTIRQSAASGGAVAADKIDWQKPEEIPDDELLGFIEGQYEAGKSRRYEWECEASEQLAWVRGYQDQVWSHTLGKLEPQVLSELPMDSRDPVIINRLRRFLLDAIGLVIGAPLDWQVYPRTRENDDVISAKAQGKLLRHFWGSSTPSGQEKILEAFWMMLATGIVWAKPTWDPYLGDAKKYDPSMMREKDEAETPANKATWLTRFKKFVSSKGGYAEESAAEELELQPGDIDLNWVSPFDLTEPEHCHRIETAPWAIISCFRTIEYMRERYGEAAKDLVADQQETFNRHRAYDSIYASVTRRTGDDVGMSEPHEVLVHELWRPISGSAKRGVCVIIAGGKVLKKQPHPYVHGGIPLVTYREFPEPVAFRPTCSIRDLMGLQRARNRQRSMLHAHLNQAINPRIMNEKGSGLAEGAFTDGPKVIHLNEDGILKVRPFEYPNPPAYMQVLDEMNLRDMDDIGGVHRSTRGQREFSGQSGKHAELLMQGDVKSAYATRQLFETSSERLGQQILCLIWQYYTEERSVEITGERGAFEILTFKGRTLIAKPPIGPTAANIKCSLGQQQTMEEVINKIRGLTEMGYFSPEREEDVATVKRWIDEQVPTETDEEGEHRGNAALENEFIMGKDGKRRAAVRVAYGDKDSVHIREHERMTTTARYKEAATKDPAVAEAFLTHLYEHLANQSTKAMMPKVIAERVKANLVETYAQPRKPPQPAVPMGGMGGPPMGPMGAMPPGMVPPMAAPVPSGMPAIGVPPGIVMPPLTPGGTM